MSGVPRVISEFATSLPVSPMWLVILAIVVLFILGCFMSPTAIVFICAPLFYPIFTAAGIPYILYGIMFIKMIEIAAVTPPFGINLFAVKANVPDCKMSDLIMGCVPFLCADFVVLGLLFFFPQIALFLPANLM
jgi:TRAP-type C4-dicarboxylate transport system permease large subunit